MPYTRLWAPYSKALHLAKQARASSSDPRSTAAVASGPDGPFTTDPIQRFTNKRLSTPPFL